MGTEDGWRLIEPHSIFLVILNQVLGVLRGRLVVGYHPNLEAPAGWSLLWSISPFLQMAGSQCLRKSNQVEAPERQQMVGAGDGFNMFVNCQWTGIWCHEIHKFGACSVEERRYGERDCKCAGWKHNVYIVCIPNEYLPTSTKKSMTNYKMSNQCFIVIDDFLSTFLVNISCQLNILSYDLFLCQLNIN